VAKIFGRAGGGSRGGRRVGKGQEPKRQLNRDGFDVNTGEAVTSAAKARMAKSYGSARTAKKMEKVDTEARRVGYERDRRASKLTGDPKTAAVEQALVRKGWRDLHKVGGELWGMPPGGSSLAEVDARWLAKAGGGAAPKVGVKATRRGYEAWDDLSDADLRGMLKSSMFGPADKVIMRRLLSDRNKS
jgi:hypothetical protein